MGKAAAVTPSERYQNVDEFRRALSELNISMSAIAAPNDYNFLRTDDFTVPNVPSVRSKARLAVILAVVCAAVAMPLIVVLGTHVFSKPKTIELILDSEYAGNFNIGGKIPLSRLREFESGVEITLSIEPWEYMEPDDILGIIPVNSDDRSMLEYLTSAEELWADENGWINIEKGDSSVTFVISREGIESLGDGGLGFETYNLIVASAALKPSEKQKELKIYDIYKERNVPYSVYDNDEGKIVTLELDGVHPVTQMAEFESQSIPKSAFYVFDGDVKVTVTLEDLEDGDNDNRSIYVFNSGCCYNVIDYDVLVPIETDGGYQPVSRDEYGIHIDKNRRQLIIIIPQHAKEKMSSGVFFHCMNVRTGKVCLEAYNGEYDVFV